MISKSTNYLTSLMLKTGTIQPEEVEIYNYLLKWLFENITYFIFFVICGLVFGNILYGLILYSVIAPLRSFGGGVHAPTKLLCDIFSYGMVVAVTGLVPIIAGYTPMIIWMIIYCISAVVIIRLVPVDCPNKRLSEEQKKRLRKKCLISLLLISTAFFVLYYLNMKPYCGIIAVGSLVVSVSDILGVVTDPKSRSAVM